MTDEYRKNLRLKAPICTRLIEEIRKWDQDAKFTYLHEGGIRLGAQGPKGVPASVPIETKRKRK